jgi:MFS-type transporter involved in bile tolerance (Atg22 family)
VLRRGGGKLNQLKNLPAIHLTISLLYALPHFPLQLVTVVAYTVLMYTDAHPYIKVTLISIPHGFVPVLTLAEISTILPVGSVGIAFGLIEVFDSIVNVSGNVVFGWLYNWTGDYHAGLVVLLVLAWGGLAALVYMVARGIPPKLVQAREVELSSRYEHGA